MRVWRREVLERRLTSEGGLFSDALRVPGSPHCLLEHAAEVAAEDGGDLFC
jgi:hypothetical protein